MSERYFVPHPIDGTLVQLQGAEAHHLAVVLRARPGDTVTLFDGSGDEFPARVLAVRRREVQLEVIGRMRTSCELPGRLVLASALPKAERARLLVEKAVELGVHCFQPLVTERSARDRPRERLGRLERVVIEASKQCGRNVLMPIAPPADWTSFLDAHAARGGRWLADPTGPLLDWRTVATAAACDKVNQITIAVGPEGGFSKSELASAERAQWTRCSLGSRILRIETAGIAFCTLAAACLAGSAIAAALDER